MQNVTPEMWQAGLVGLIIGFLAAYILLRLTKDSVKKQVQTESELQKVKSELNTQKQQLEKHFAESAELLKNIAQDYQKLYQHLASSANNLLPDQTDNTLFKQALLEPAKENTSEEKTSNDDDQPKDYSEGSSGILKAER